MKAYSVTYPEKNILFHHEHLQNQKVGKLITKDDIINLVILLNTTNSIDEFLQKISI